MSNKIQKLLTVFASLFVAASLVVVIQEPAMAAPYCPSNSICLFSNSGGGGSVLTVPSLPGSCYSLGGGWDNVTSSLVSNLGYAVHLRDGWNCSGQDFYVGYAVPNYISGLGGWPDFFNDKASAIQFWN